METNGKMYINRRDMELTKGKAYETRGGWKAVVIWISAPQEGLCLEERAYAIHKPGDEQESQPIYHRPDGTAAAIFSVIVNEPPTYGIPHPADLMREWPDEVQGDHPRPW